jgi:hypothetical protein
MAKYYFVKQLGKKGENPKIKMKHEILTVFKY